MSLSGVGGAGLAPPRCDSLVWFANFNGQLPMCPIADVRSRIVDAPFWECAGSCLVH